MTTEELILHKYGRPLLNYEQIADLLDRTPGAIRLMLYRPGTINDQLRRCRVRIGKRVLFRVADVARLVDEG